MPADYGYLPLGENVTRGPVHYAPYEPTIYVPKTLGQLWTAIPKVAGYSPTPDYGGPVGVLASSAAFHVPFAEQTFPYEWPEGSVNLKIIRWAKPFLEMPGFAHLSQRIVETGPAGGFKRLVSVQIEGWPHYGILPKTVAIPGLGARTKGFIADFFVPAIAHAGRMLDKGIAFVHIDLAPFFSGQQVMSPANFIFYVRAEVEPLRMTKEFVSTLTRAAWFALIRQWQEESVEQAGVASLVGSPIAPPQESSFPSASHAITPTPASQAIMLEIGRNEARLRLKYQGFFNEFVKFALDKVG